MTEPTTMGAYLRAARRKRRVSIERAAEETRIRKDFLMRMESDEFDFLAPAYVRGFLRSYARFLRVPVEPLVEEFDRIVGIARIDTGQIAAIERRAKRNTPKERPLKNNWALAAVIALVAIIALGAIGLVNEPDGAPTGRVASGDTPSPAPSVAPSESATPTPTPTPTEEVVAFTDGIEVTIEATNEACWVDVTADDVNVYTSPSNGLQVGESAGPFTAEEEMTIILGNAGGVELIVNGKRIGPLGNSGEVLTLNLPEDVEELI